MAAELTAPLQASLASSISVINATATALTTANPGQGLFGTTGHVLATMKVVPTFLVWLAAFATFTLPAWLYAGLSTSLTVTINATTLFLNVYTRLPQEPPRKEPQIDIFPDTSDGDSKPGLGQYFDEILSAIKVFGYLERPVFHELTRTMQTKKLIAGETLLLEEEKGFCLVVDGLVQIFVKSLREDTNVSGESHGFLDDENGYHDGSQGYQLLTEVKNGASMSSLFSILSLFTEDVRLRFDESSRPASSNGFVNPPTPGFMQSSTGPSTPIHETTSSKHVLSDGVKSSKLAKVPPLTLETPFEEDYFRQKVRSKREDRKPKSVHPDIVARAVVDTTIAIIPASAFRRLTRTYPQATAHIIQVIIARLQRVTLSTAHQYLGLTSEVLQIEKLMNKYTSYDLPNMLRGGALDRLRDKFAKEIERLGNEDITKGIALHNPVTNRRRSSTGLRKEAALAARIAAARQSSGDPVESAGTDVNAGDLATNVSTARLIGRAGSLSSRNPPWNLMSELNSSRAGGLSSPLGIREKTTARPPSQNGPILRQDSSSEDTLLRESVLDCMVKALGLDMNARDIHRRTGAGGVSVEQSPRLVSYDARRQTAVFSNAFGMIDPYGGSVDGDTESVVSSVASLVGQGARNMHDELIDDVEIVFFPKGSVLVEQGERNPGVYYVIDGFLDVSIPVEDKPNKHATTTTNGPPQEKRAPALRRTKTASSRASSIPGLSQEPLKKQVQKSLFLVKPGGIAGYIGTLSFHRSLTDVTAKTDVYVGFLPRQSLERVAERYPILLLTIAKRLTNLLPRLILHIDFALEWVQIDAGQIIHRQGDDSDAIYIVLNGRLRAIRENSDGSLQATAEYGQGESIGELEVMTEGTRPATLHAIRDTELCRFPRSLFNSLAQEHPSITIQISKLIAQRMRALIENPVIDDMKERKGKAGIADGSSSLNLRTIAILPVTTGVPVVEFSHRLLSALTQVGIPNGATSLNQAVVLNHLGRHAFSRMGKLKLSQYLTDLEEKYGMVLYVADTTVSSPWTQTCIKQADCILLVGLAESSPSMGEYERFLLSMKTTARKDLVLLHMEKFSKPGLTAKWLRNRGWVNGGHHHVHMSYRIQSHAIPPQPRRLGTAIKKRVEVIQAEIQKYTSRRVRQQPLFSAETPFKGDFHRLARRLCGRSVGLVLGGGGARGLAHIGVIRAIEEAGIPVDLIGGTSIGAFIGGLYARDAEVVSMYGRAKRFAGRMGSIWRFALDLTYPSVSYTTGHEFNRGIYKTFGNSQIEDFWINFYCNTTNISKSRAEFHTSGYAWRYIRASMTLAGLIPPICDQGSMLLDGGYIDNLTVAHMKSLGADLVLAVDVGAIDDDTPQEFGDSLSGVWAVLQRWNPFSTAPSPPTSSEIQGRLAYVSSVDALERAKTTPGVVYMRPPVVAYATLDFAKFDEICNIGYSFAKEFLSTLKAKGELQGISEGNIGVEGAGEEARLRRTMAPRRASI
ncbi:phosphatidylcholine and lysophosphatidylcholine phospholipase [Lithohypha guttulata]|uniref:Lysophospholipase NTE1 n=1 Tax=Lithohypha guttulata TaxID=1690604 RepID=A0AAN7SUN6_9EURO|nr:phosphatidylcholine and lysophosphatidylcholine phospholipase [Lithohypha guttulata]KAK5081976.1 phosphatidylcholine and lysophosphatidylcholine phospholipase [Lithohypha guttulata]